jgi:hypothetical protein
MFSRADERSSRRGRKSTDVISSRESGRVRGHLLRPRREIKIRGRGPKLPYCLWDSCVCVVVVMEAKIDWSKGKESRKRREQESEL